MQKSLTVKCKEMLSQNYSKRYEGVIDDIDMNLWPAPLKIAHQTINSMKEFRVRMIRVMEVNSPNCMVNSTGSK